jgi:hypothetical protein
LSSFNWKFRGSNLIESIKRDSFNKNKLMVGHFLNESIKCKFRVFWELLRIKKANFIVNIEVLFWLIRDNLILLLIFNKFSFFLIILLFLFLLFFLDYLLLIDWDFIREIFDFNYSYFIFKTHLCCQPILQIK